MEEPRFPNPVNVLVPQSAPGERETRFPLPRDRSRNHPRKEQTHV